MNRLYLECSAGISGDMTAAALIDLGADTEKLNRVLSGIKAKGFTTRISRVKKNGIDCCDFDVRLDEAHENHDHDMEYLYGHLSGEQEEETEHGHSHGHHHGHHHGHSHDQEHSHEHGHSHEHEHRNLADVTKIINSLDMTDKARELAIRIFTILAEAEAKAHGTTIDKVHFHEVGAIDSIVDIVACAVCFDDLDISEVIIPKLCEGSGSVRCRHGILPVPVPAVLNIASECGLPLSITNRQGEYVTPTGAAFAGAVMTGTRLPEVFIPVRTGLGAGKREHEIPGILRAVLFRTED